MKVRLITTSEKNTAWYLVNDEIVGVTEYGTLLHGDGSFFQDTQPDSASKRLKIVAAINKFDNAHEDDYQDEGEILN